MPVELGLALYRSHVTKGKHRVFIFEHRQYRAQRSTSDVNGIDPQIHKGTVRGLMGALRNIFRQPQDVTTVPEMIASYRAVKQRIPELRRNAGSTPIFEAAIFQAQGCGADRVAKLIALRPRRTVHDNTPDSQLRGPGDAWDPFSKSMQRRSLNFRLCGALLQLQNQAIGRFDLLWLLHPIVRSIARLVTPGGGRSLGQPGRLARLGSGWRGQRPQSETAQLPLCLQGPLD